MVYAVVGIMMVVIIALLIKICLLKRSAREITEELIGRLDTDTNTVIGISSRDKDMLRLAKSINEQLRAVRKAHLRYTQGDAELKATVTNISHDLRTPLTAICGYLDLLDMEEKSPEAERYIEIIGERIESMRLLTEELFRYSVIVTADKEMTREEVSLGRVLEESIAAFYAVLCEKGITPLIKMPESRVVRTLDRSALSRIFSNLISNAVKYSNGDLEITLTESGKITFSNKAADLNEVQVGRLFDRFYTVEVSRKSTGLGLSIAKTLTEQLGGTISADYTDGRLTICICFD